MPKKIAYIGIKGLPSQAGVDRVVEAIVRRLDLQRYQPVVYCSQRHVPPHTYIPGVRLVRMPSLPGKHLHAFSLYLISALHALLFGNYHMVHVHNVEACFVLPLLRLRYRVVSTSHGAAQAREKWGRVARRLIQLMEYPFVMLSNQRTTVSLPLAEYYRQQYHRPVVYLPNGVAEEAEIDEETAVSLMQRYHIQPGQFILFAAGRIIPTKGCHLLLEAYRQLETDLPLVIVGDMGHIPAYEQKLRQMADERVRFVPFVADKGTLFGLVKAARLFVFPSLVEGMSMMLLETAVCGTPILCSDIPENKAAFSDQLLYFHSADPDDLRQKLTWALAHPEEMHRMGQNAQNWVRENYLWPQIVRAYERLYETV